MVITAQTHPQLQWQRLQARLPNGLVLNQPHVIFTTYPIANGRHQIIAYDERNVMNRYEYQCSHPQRALVRIIDWARQYAL